MSTSRKRKVWSVKNELMTKSREAMLTAVQIFNNPNIHFKSESFIVLSNIAWTYLMHAYFREKQIDYRFFDERGQRKRYHRTQRGAYKYWDLETCLNHPRCPVDKVSKANIKFLIGLRHEIEHQMTTNIDDYLSARFQASCLNYNQYIKNTFGRENGIDKHLSFSLQFSSISEDQSTELRKFSDLPVNIATYINSYDSTLGDDEFNSPKYSYRVLYVPKTANRKGQADKVIEFIKADSPEALGLNREYTVIKESEKTKHLPKEIVEHMKQKGFKNFNMYHHTLAWKKMDGKNPNKGFGASVAGTWYWYDKWISEVEKYCKKNRSILT